MVVVDIGNVDIDVDDDIFIFILLFSRLKKGGREALLIVVVG